MLGAIAQSYTDHLDPSKHYRCYIDGTGTLSAKPHAAPSTGAVIIDKTTGSLHMVLDGGDSGGPGWARHFKFRTVQCNTTVTVSRFSADHSAGPEPEIIAADLPAYIECSLATPDDSPAGPVQHNRYRLLVPHTDIRQRDRLTTDDGKTLLVEVVDRCQYDGIASIVAIEDNR